jgi:ATP-dependent exoDNAse (exonuclease V) beta subunit
MTGDSAARELIRTRLDCNMVVEAAAGTGKTSELVRRIVAVLASGRAHVDSVVAVTFTEKAAGELKLRLRATLEQARQSAQTTAERGHLEQALARLEQARIGTIHGFCADLLRERPVEARVDPRLLVLTEPESIRMFDGVFDRWLEQQLQAPPEGVRRSLRRRAAGDGSPAGRLRQAAWQLAGFRDFPAPWRRDPFAREAAIDALCVQLFAFSQLSGAPFAANDPLYRGTEPARRLAQEIERSERARPRDYDGLEGALCVLSAERDFRRARAGRGRDYGRGIARAAVREAHEALVSELEAFARAADADLAAALQPELFAAIERYEHEKAQQGALDFLDLLLRARDLIRDSDEVRADFQQRFSHVFVDEFQDTDPLQAEILLLLCASDPAQRDFRKAAPAPGKLFVVGDPKQSIYRFRRADLGAYHDATAWLIEHGALHVRLSTSFRAVPSLQRFVNAAFAPAMQAAAIAQGGDVSAAHAYVPLEPFRDENAAQPSLIALPVPKPYGKRGDVTKTAIEASLPDAVAALVDWLVTKRGWTVSERERPGERVPIGARHVCLLFRRFDSWFSGDITRGYVRALEARGVPHLLVGGRSFHAREEIETLRAALCAIEWPDDTLSVYACLRGTLFAIDDELLLGYTHRFGALHPLRIPREPLEPALAPIGEALTLLAALHRTRNRRSLAETIAILLEATRAHAGFVLRPAGEQVLANVLHLAELARAYELSGGLSFRAFVERLLDESESRRTAEAPIMEEGSDGVRLMTAFKAKGLEFPVVILADITARPSGQADRYVDPARGLCALRIAGWTPAELIEHAGDEQRLDEAEALRIAYVAATRARDLLVVPVVGDESFDEGWVSSLNPALYPEPARWRHAEAAPRCPPFGSDATLDRGQSQTPDDSGVRPGLHRMRAPYSGAGAPAAAPRGDDGGEPSAEADYGVVFWDPRALALDVAPRLGVRRTELIHKGVERSIVDADLAAFHGWQSAREAALTHGSLPTVRCRTATAHALLRSEAASPLGRPVELVHVARDLQRPSGKRFGALVHAVLAVAPLGAGEAALARLCEQQGRVLAALPEEVSGAARATRDALAHPLLQRAAQARTRGDCRRETPVTIRDAEGALIEGVVDLAFREAGRWTVIDFKTDLDISRGIDAYRQQVSAYADAIETATGEPTGAVLLLV